MCQWLGGGGGDGTTHAGLDGQERGRGGGTVAQREANAAGVAPMKTGRQSAPAPALVVSSVRRIVKMVTDMPASKASSEADKPATPAPRTATEGRQDITPVQRRCDTPSSSQNRSC